MHMVWQDNPCVDAKGPLTSGYSHRLPESLYFLRQEIGSARGKCYGKEHRRAVLLWADVIGHKYVLHWRWLKNCFTIWNSGAPFRVRFAQANLTAPDPPPRGGRDWGRTLRAPSVRAQPDLHPVTALGAGAQEVCCITPGPRRRARAFDGKMVHLTSPPSQASPSLHSAAPFSARGLGLSCHSGGNC